MSICTRVTMTEISTKDVFIANRYIKVYLISVINESLLWKYQQGMFPDVS